MQSISLKKFSLPGAAKTAHLFVDASNVNVTPHEIPALDAIARDGFSSFATAFVVGSTAVRSQKEAIWTSLGYKAKFSVRNGQPESAFNVDCTIVSAMQRDILQHEHDSTGNSNNLHQSQRAIELQLLLLSHSLTAQAA
jgi:hypothetical protein